MEEHMQAVYNGMALIGSLVITALVIAVTYVASRWYAGRMQNGAAGKHVKVVDKIMLGSGCALIVVQAAGKLYLLGLGDKNVRLLCELESLTPEMYEGLDSQGSFGQLFNAFLKKSKGRDASGGNGGES